MRAILGNRSNAVSTPTVLSVLTAIQCEPSSVPQIEEVLQDETRTEWQIADASSSDKIEAVAKVTCTREAAAGFAEQLGKLDLDFTLAYNDDDGILTVQVSVHSSAFTGCFLNSDLLSPCLMRMLKAPEEAGRIALHAPFGADMSRQFLNAAERSQSDSRRYRISIDPNKWSRWQLLFIREAFLIGKEDAEGGEEGGWMEIQLPEIASMGEQVEWSTLAKTYEQQFERSRYNDSFVRQMVRELPLSIARDPAILHFTDRMGWDFQPYVRVQLSDSVTKFRCRHPVHLLVWIRRHLVVLGNKGWLVEAAWDPTTAMYELTVEATTKFDSGDFAQLPCRYNVTSVAEALHVLYNALKCSARIDPFILVHEVSDDQIQFQAILMSEAWASSTSASAGLAKNWISGDPTENLIVEHDVETLLGELRHSHSFLAMAEGCQDTTAWFRQNPFADGNFQKHVELVSYYLAQGCPHPSSWASFANPKVQPSPRHVLEAYERVTGADTDWQARKCLDNIIEENKGSILAMESGELYTRYPVLTVAKILDASVDEGHSMLAIARDAGGVFCIHIASMNKLRTCSMWNRRLCSLPKAASLLKALQIVPRLPHFEIRSVGVRHTLLFTNKRVAESCDRFVLDLNKPWEMIIDRKALMKHVAATAAVTCKSDAGARQVKVAVNWKSLTRFDAILFRYLLDLYEERRVVGRETGAEHLIWEVHWLKGVDTIHFHRPRTLGQIIIPGTKQRKRKAVDSATIVSAWQSFMESDRWLASLTPIGDSWVSYLIRIYPLVWGPLTRDYLTEGIWQGNPLTPDQSLTYCLGRAQDGSTSLTTASPVLLIALLLDEEHSITGIQTNGAKIALKLGNETAPENLRRLIDVRFGQLHVDSTPIRPRLRRAAHIFSWLLARAQPSESVSGVALRAA